MSVKSLGYGGDGASATVALGNVSTGAAGSSVSITNSGTTSAAVFNFTIPRGDTGATPTISIGTVTTLAPGASATASFSGTALNLGIPAGAAGGTPANPSISIGTVSTLASGASATASITGTYPNYSLNLGIPAGNPGNGGSPPGLAIGNVTTLSAGASATASITGSAPNYSLNLGIPAGAAGSNASATPLGNATPLANGTASAGSSTSAARDDHRHPLQAGTLTLVGTATVGETLLVSLSLGVKRYTGTISGLAVGDRIMAFLTGSPGSSSLQDIYVSAANTYNVGLLNPALGIGATVAVPIAVYRLT